ncbi:hypothetical protein ACOSQ4_027390 [Xanthoceras sorbifolium]
MLFCISMTVLKLEDVEIGEPCEGEIRVRNKAIGINFIDVYFRRGFYKASSMPFVPGMEAVGEVIALGPGLIGRKIWDVVAYVLDPMGSYAEEQILPAEKVVPVPPSIDPTIATPVLLKGMTAQILLHGCFKVEPGHTILVHAAAGGKVTPVEDDGCHHVIIYTEEDFVARVFGITSGNGVDVVYDSIGKNTFQPQGSLACLKMRDYTVSFGQVSGLVDPVPISALQPKSLFLTRASLALYMLTQEELLVTAREVFANVASCVLLVRVSHAYPLSQAAQADAALESRKTSGSLVLLP